MIDVKIIHLKGCDGAVTSRAMVEEVAQELNTPVTIENILIETEEKAIEYRHIGSPTIQINGLDIDPSVRESTLFGIT